jgi:hypothetical protein
MPSTERCSSAKRRTSAPTTSASTACTGRPSAWLRAGSVTELPVPLPGMSGKDPTMLVAAPERGSMNA